MTTAVFLQRNVIAGLSIDHFLRPAFSDWDDEPNGSMSVYVLTSMADLPPLGWCKSLWQSREVDKRHVSWDHVTWVRSAYASFLFGHTFVVFVG